MMPGEVFLESYLAASPNALEQFCFGWGWGREIGALHGLITSELCFQESKNLRKETKHSESMYSARCLFQQNTEGLK